LTANKTKQNKTKALRDEGRAFDHLSCTNQKRSGASIEYPALEWEKKREKKKKRDPTPQLLKD
jgi:hypothetical protein